MKGNKGQIGNNFVGMKCVLVNKRTDKINVEYEIIEFDEEYQGRPRFLLKNNKDELLRCIRSDFKFPRNK